MILSLSPWLSGLVAALGPTSLLDGAGLADVVRVGCVAGVVGAALGEAEGETDGVGEAVLLAVVGDADAVGVPPLGVLEVLMASGGTSI